MTKTRDLELDNLDENTKKQALNEKIALGVSIADSIGFMAILSMYVHESLRLYLQQTLRFILFPIGAVAAAIQAILACRQAHLDGKTSSIIRACVETITAAAIVTAIIGGIAATTAFVTAGPAIFIAVSGIKTLHSAGNAIYNTYKAVNTKNNPARRQEYKTHAITHAIHTGLGAVLTVVLGCAMLAAKFLLAPLGIAAICGAMGYGMYKAFTASSEKKAGAEPVADTGTDANIGNDSARIQRELNTKQDIGNMLAPVNETTPLLLAPSTHDPRIFGSSVPIEHIWLICTNRTKKFAAKIS